MSTPTIQIAITILIGLACIVGALTIGTRAVSYAVQQVRAMRSSGAETTEAARARVLARARLKNLAFLFVFAAVPATISFAHLVSYAHDALGLSAPLTYLVPLALDEAALYLMMLAFADADAGVSAAANRMLVWAFAGGSAWFNWLQAPSGPAHPGAPQFFAGMSLAAGVLFERGLANVRRSHHKAQGLTRSPLPKVGVLRWLTAPRETAAMMRIAITEPTITTEADALAAVRMRRTLRAQRRQADQEARATAAQEAPGRWWRRRTVVVPMSPVFALATGTTAVRPTALATVLEPYARAERAEAAKGVPQQAAQPLTLESVLTMAAQAGTPAQVEQQTEELDAYVRHMESRADETERVLTTGAIPHQETPPHKDDEAEPEGCYPDTARLTVVPARSTSKEITARLTAEPEETRHTHTPAVEQERAEPAAAPEPAQQPRRKDGTKKAQFLAMCAEMGVRPDDPRCNNAIAEEVRSTLRDRYGVRYDRGAAQRAVGEHRAALATQPGTPALTQG
ncbi:DUF2637 domain-containing protein [Streptomyces sp. NPDC090442]|uniref:DUF2637 domain-containing protein n=1 Tax=Streptomyces sp. NPDC090442 TaxID=3365962 RepID=UPI0037FA8BA8